MNGSGASSFGRSRGEDNGEVSRWILPRNREPAAASSREAVLLSEALPTGKDTEAKLGDT